METKFDAVGDEMFELIRGIKDPEHPQTLEELHVVYPSGVEVYGCVEQSDQNSELSSDRKYRVQVEFTPTVPHCSLATLIGLCIRVKLEESYPGLLKLDIIVKEGSHDTASQITKQLNDKERVAAALENPNMRKLVDECVLYS